MNGIVTWFFLILSLMAIVATVLPLSKYEAWWIRSLDFPRLQIIAAGSFCLFGYTYFNDSQGIGQILLETILAACIVWQAWKIFPYTILARKMAHDSKKTADKAAQVSLVVTNVLMTNHHYADCLQMLRKADPDLILAVETNQAWQDNLKELEKDYPYTIFHPLENTYGLLFYSRLKFRDPEVKFLLEDDVPSVHAVLQLASGTEVIFHGIHPRPPAPQEASSSVPRDAELIVVGLDILQNPGPTIVAGDLNDVAWSHTSKLFRKTSGLLDPRIGRGLFATFHAGYPLLRWPLDHVFHTRDFRILSLRRLENIRSDHFPICIHLSYEPESQHEQEKPKADHEDKEEAVEKLEKAAERKAENGSVSA
jgi:endonuclease/exonuclease/phosphatase (EEP) superfamily protein YafD